MTYVNQAQARIKARVLESAQGAFDLGEWKEMEGGNTIAEAFKVRPPGQPQRAYFNPVRETEDITLRRDFRLEQDWKLRKDLRNIVGMARVQVDVTPLANSLAAWEGEGPDTFQGVLIDVQPYDINRDTGSEAGQFVLVIAADEKVA